MGILLNLAALTLYFRRAIFPKMPPAERTGHLDRELVHPGEPGFFNTLNVLAKTPDGAVVASKKFVLLTRRNRCSGGTIANSRRGRNATSNHPLDIGSKPHSSSR